jgi:hypothetical protein
MAKTDLRGNFIDMNTYIKNTERSQINDLMLHLKLLEKQEQINPKQAEGEKRREIKKQELKSMRQGPSFPPHQKKTYKESTKQKAGSLKKINKIFICKLLANLKRGGKRPKLIKSETKRGR